MAAYKRLSTGQRVQIQTMLDSRCSFKKIAEELNKLIPMSSTKG